MIWTWIGRGGISHWPIKARSWCGMCAAIYWQNMRAAHLHFASPPLYLFDHAYTKSKYLLPEPYTLFDFGPFLEKKIPRGYLFFSSLYFSLWMKSPTSTTLKIAHQHQNIKFDHLICCKYHKQILTVQPNGFSLELSTSRRQDCLWKKSGLSLIGLVKGITQKRSPVLTIHKSSND